MVIILKGPMLSGSTIQQQTVDSFIASIIMSQIVKFNIGGQRYEVARSRLEMHPTTMLAKIASERWQDNPEAEIFIDRDGMRFRYVLDYLRDGKVSLPVTVSKEALLTELQYYCIDCDQESVDESAAYKVTSIPSMKMAIHDLKSEVARLGKDATELDINARCGQLAVDCVQTYLYCVCNTTTANEPIYLRNHLNDENLCKAKEHLAKLLPLTGDQKLIEEKVNLFLHKVGLTMSRLNSSYGYVRNAEGERECFFTSVKVCVRDVKEIK